jgi:hypothetical protein
MRMPTAQATFRAIIIAQPLLPFLRRISEVVLGIHRPSAVGSGEPPLIVILGLAIALIIVAVGLWRFRWWARISHIALVVSAVVYSVASTPAGRVSAHNVHWMYLEALMEGVFLAMMFLPPLSDRFARPRPNQAMQRTAGRSAF